MNFNPAREQFYAANGNDYVNTPDGTHLFITGAEVEPGYGDMGMMSMPPSDPWELAKKIVRYWEIKVQRVAGEFNECKQYLSGSGHYTFPRNIANDEEKQLEHLEKLQRIVRSTRRKLRLAIEEADDLEPAHRKACRRSPAEEMEYDERLRSRVDRINI
jgi:hypothetical protein